MCWRVAGSKGQGKVDLVACKAGEWVLIQCKKDGWIDNQERHELIRTAGEGDALAVIAYKSKGEIHFRHLIGWAPWSRADREKADADAQARPKGGIIFVIKTERGQS